MSFHLRSSILRLPTALVAVALAPLTPRTAAAQDITYKQPPAPIAQMMDAEPLPGVILSPARDRLLLIHRAQMPSISEVAAPFLRLAGDRINPRTFGSWYETGYTSIVLRDMNGSSTGRERTIALPKGFAATGATWAPDGAHVAITLRGPTGITLWVADASTGAAHQLSSGKLNAVAGPPCAWATKSALVCRMVVPNRGAPPSANDLPTGPVVQETEGPASANPTFQDLLQNPTDEKLFDYYATSQIAVASLDGKTRVIAPAAVYTAARPSPDGRFVLLQQVHRPYSYQVPRFRFPTRTELITIDGGKVRTLADVPLAERVGRQNDAVAAGFRDPAWRTDAPATVVWAEALDNGDPTANVPKHDRVLMLAEPFVGEPRTLIDLEYRFASANWARADLGVIDEFWWKTRRTRSWSVNPTAPVGARKLFDQSFEDRYADPGTFVTTPGAFGRPVLLTSTDGSKLYLAGQGASAEGDRPFLDRFDLGTGAKERLFRSEAPSYEQPVTVLDRDGTRIVTRRESITEVPNYYVRDLTKKSLSAITAFKDPAPQFAGVTKELITYKRPDGVQLSATMYLPAGYDKRNGPLPFLFWAYPQEFKSASAASQVIGSPYRFTRPTSISHLFLLTQGYGILDGPTMPIVGEGEKEPNDTYVPQLVASAKAAVDKIVDMGVGSRDQVGVGGHSYGAFMTANLLAHSHLFQAGIARSGAYNRTLTPFGFQAEERDYWHARDVYTNMSPFSFADSISAPILLIHGMADDNQGTFPVQSERFFAALKGNGKKARLVMLPAEPHGYRARESSGHVLHEMVSWLDRYVKAKPKPKAD